MTILIMSFAMQATIDVEMEAKQMEHKKEKDLLGRRHMDRDNALRKVRKAGLALTSAQDQLPPLKASMHASKLDVTALTKLQVKTGASVVELKKDTDILINSFLKEEKKVRSYSRCVLHAMLANAGSCVCCDADHTMSLSWLRLLDTAEAVYSQ